MATTNTEAPNTLLSNTTLNILDLLCEGRISGFTYRSATYTGDPLMSTFYNDVQVRNVDGSYNYNVSGAGFNFQYMLGTSVQTGIPGFQKVETVIPLGANTLVSNPLPGAGPYKTVVAGFNTQMYPDVDSVKVTMRVPALFSQDDQGNTNGYNVGYAIDVALNDGPFTPMVTDTFNGKCTVPYLRDHVIVLPKTTPPGSYYAWKVRVRRTTTDIQSIRTQNAIYVDSMSLISSSLYAYPNSVMVATEISANQFSDIPARAYDIYGTLVSVPNGYTPTQYDLSGNFLAAATYPNVWTGDFKQNVWTDNPAWIFYDLLTNPVHGLGDYISSGSVDKWTLYQLAQYCDQLVDNGASGLYGAATLEPRFTCNVAIQQPEQAYSVLLNLASTFRGMLYYANGTIHPISTNDVQSPVYEFNNSNVVNGTFSYSDTANETRSTVAMVKYTDPKNGWRDNVAYVEDVNGILRYGYVEKQMSAFACTTQGQAYRLGSWTLESERLLTETVTFQTSMEGLYVMPGDVFAVYDNFRNNRTQAGRIQAVSTGGSHVVLDRPIALDAGITYSLTCVVPEYVLTTSNLTGSDQIPQLRNPQIQSFRVIDGPTSSVQELTVAGQFSSGIYVGSPWILSASGSTGIFNKASFYTCLATSEIEPGKMEVLGLQANTGIVFNISTGYTVVDQPPNAGNTAGIQPPSNLLATWVTGALADNTFFSNFALNWTDSPSSNLGRYAWSGQTPGFGYSGFSTVGPNGVFPVTVPGTYNFKVAAVSQGGVYSTYDSTIGIIPNANPFGTNFPLSGLFIFKDPDDIYRDPVTHNQTGYVGTRPGIGWNFQQDLARSTDVPSFDLVTGYRVRISGFDGTSNYLVPPIVMEGRNNDFYTFPDRFLYTGLGGTPRRGFDFWVDILDQYGGIYTGGHLKVNNEPPGPPASTGFVGYNSGLFYNVVPALNNDVSGLYLWWSVSSGFSPTFSNFGYVTDNFAGSVNTSIYQLNPYYAWYAITDTFGTVNCPIYGPIPIDSNGIVANLTLNISGAIAAANAAISGANLAISGAFSQLTGMITAASIVSSGNDALIVTTVNGLSGQIMGTTPGNINTALNVRMDSITVSSSGALSQQINAVRAITELTGQQLTATVGTVSTALTTTGVALGQRVDLVQANLVTTGQTLNSSVATVSTALTASGVALGSSINLVQSNVNSTNSTVATLSATTAAADSALAQWITNLGVQTSGATSSVQIGARAFVTGGSNGIGGVAVARWGFKLDANGKVVSMEATSDSFPGSYGAIVFGGANLESDTYTSSAGTVGWQITAGGNARFNDISARGSFTGGAGSALAVINPDGLTVGNPAGFHASVGAGAPFFKSYDGASLCFEGGLLDSAGTSYGSLRLYKESDATPYVNLTAENNGSIFLNSSSYYFKGNGQILCSQVNAGAGIVGAGTVTASAVYSTYIEADGNGIFYAGIGGANQIGFIWDHPAYPGVVTVWVDGSKQGTIPNP